MCCVANSSITLERSRCPLCNSAKCLKNWTSRQITAIFAVRTQTGVLLWQQRPIDSVGNLQRRHFGRESRSYIDCLSMWCVGQRQR